MIFWFVYHHVSFCTTKTKTADVIKTASLPWGLAHKLDGAGWTLVMVIANADCMVQQFFMA